MDEVPSPCIQVCRIDETTDCCAGCSRTRAEIAAWRESSAPEKARIVADLPRRSVVNADLYGNR